MRQLAILNFLASAVKELSSEQTFPIYLPNEPIPEDANDAKLFFELFCGDQAQEIETEHSTISGVVGSIVINGKQNAGIALVDKVADDLVLAFSPTNRFQKRGFSVLNSETGVVERLYAISVERSEGGIDEGRFKTTVFITFEIFEDKI